MASPVSPPPETTPTWTAGVRRRLPFYLLTSLVLAILAGFLTFRYLDRLRSAALPTAKALVARQDIPAGASIVETMIEVREVPEAILPAGHLTDPAQAVGREPVFDIVANEVLLPSRFHGAAQAALSARLPDGRWAMVLPGGWLVSPVPELASGDRIDLLAYQGGQPSQTAGLVVSDLAVLLFVGPADNPEQLTLTVTLEEAKAIFVSHVNGFSLLPLLRPQED